MPTSFSARLLRRPSLSFAIFCVFLVVLWTAGGASRADVFGQVIVRLVAVGALFVLAMFGERPVIARARPVWWLLLAATGLAVLQLIPLPPALWQALPGRAMFTEAMLGQPQPWRPIAIVPGAAINALVSLIVPLLVLIALTGIREDERALVPGVILAMVVASNLLGLMQFSGAGFDNPFINDTPGEMSSSFANRNHYALLLALGCLLVPAWVFAEGRRSRGRAVIGLSLILLFLLTILASGSRAGMVLGALALCGTLLVARNGIRRELHRAPNWVMPALIGCVVVLIATFVLISIAADRAVSIQRMFDVDVGSDMRSRALPTVWAMTLGYFPFGAGLGSFDPVFRIHEPLALLKPTFFNHAHNDLIEVVLDAGLPGLLLLLAALTWWGWASVRTWRSRVAANPMLPRIGSAMLLLIILASVFDYPARTPMMMALTVVAALWLHQNQAPRGG